MKTCKIIYLILALVGFVSCDVEGHVWVDVMYTNDTEHHIGVCLNKSTDVMEILPDQTSLIISNEVLYPYYDNGFNQKPFYTDEFRRSVLTQSLPRIVTVVWDGEYAITYSYDTNSSERILTAEGYKLIKPVNRGCLRYSYTFTEEDYEYAKANGVKLDGSDEK